METPRRALRNLHMENVQKLSTPMKIPASPFMKKLGYGTGVSVFRLERSKAGQLLSPWAVKRVSQRARVNDDKVLFNARIQAEAEILRKLSHKNIVGFRGVTKAEDGVDSLVLECCKTSLGDILEERCEQEMGALPAKNILRMIFDITQALDYLHTEAKLLHGDLKSFNILVKDDFEICKLCDFGVSLPLDNDGLINFTKTPNLHYVGTNLWSAPEIMDDSEVIDCKADIFSFGLVIYETIALVPPHTLDISDNEKTNDTENSFMNSSKDSDVNGTDSVKEYSYAERMDNACGTRPPLPVAFALGVEYNPILELFYCCTNELAEDRPTASTIWQSLEKAEKKPLSESFTPSPKRYGEPIEQSGVG